MPPPQEDIEETGDHQDERKSRHTSSVASVDGRVASQSSQALPMSAEKQPSSFSDQAHNSNYYSHGGYRASPPQAYYHSRKADVWSSASPQSVHRKALEKVHKAIKNNQVMFMLRAHDDTKGVDLANPRNRAQVSVSLLLVRREPLVMYPFSGFFAQILPDGVKVNKYLQAKRGLMRTQVQLQFLPIPPSRGEEGALLLKSRRT